VGFTGWQPNHVGAVGPSCAQFEAVGLVVPAPIDSATFGRFIDAETAKWGPLIKAKSITLD